MLEPHLCNTWRVDDQWGATPLLECNAASNLVHAEEALVVDVASIDLQQAQAQFPFACLISDSLHAIGGGGEPSAIIDAVNAANAHTV